MSRPPTALLVACAGDRFDIEWMWGDGTSTKVENHTAAGEETISARHAYGIGGIMDLTVKVTNRATQEERTNDLAGNPRVKKLMDMGCYEFAGSAPTMIIVR